ncbi:MAG TPA: hypothetical protein O0X27_05595 [Methanocorpusculum sp.]|nr:hypothetical protein [Methanocorpusculum sp.]
MIREVQRIDTLTIDTDRYTATFAGITAPLSLITLTEGTDAGRRRLTLRYNNDVYVLRSHTSDPEEIRAADRSIDAALKSYAAATKAHALAVKKAEKAEKHKTGKFAQMKERMQTMQENALRIDKRNGRVHFAGNDVSALDVRMDVTEYGGYKRLTIEYNDQLYSMAPPAAKGKFSQKMMNAKMDMAYNDYLKARERALDL